GTSCPLLHQALPSTGGAGGRRTAAGRMIAPRPGRGQRPPRFCPARHRVLSWGWVAVPADRSPEIAMLVVMHSHASPQQIDDVVRAIRDMNLTPHAMPGATRTAIGITGNVGAVDPRTLEVLPGVMELIRVTKPYKLASREMHAADTYVRLPQTTIGPGTFTLIAGPCSVGNA